MISNNSEYSNKRVYIITKQRQIHTVLFALCFVLTFVQHATAQAVLGAREMAMGQSVTALQSSTFSVFSNPAMMPENEKRASFYGVRYYGLAEISDVAAAVTWPTSAGIFGGGIHRYGFDLFSESRFRIAYKHKLKEFRFGFIFNYNHVAQGGGYGNAGAWGVDMGMAAPLFPELWIGAKAINVNRPVYGSLNDEELPRELSVGLSYGLSESVLISTDIVKDVKFPVSWRSGVEIIIIESLLARAGFTTAPRTFSAGFGYSGPVWGAGVSVQRHENSVLGYSPAFDLHILW